MKMVSVGKWRLLCIPVHAMTQHFPIETKAVAHSCGGDNCATHGQGRERKTSGAFERWQGWWGTKEFLRRGTINDVDIYGPVGIVDGGHHVVNHLVEVALWGRVVDGLHESHQWIGQQGQIQKQTKKCKSGMQTNMHTWHIKQFTWNARWVSQMFLLKFAWLSSYLYM